MSDQAVASLLAAFSPTVATDDRFRTRQCVSCLRGICMSAFLAGIAHALSLTPAIGGQVCKPILALRDAQFSAIQPPNLERKWTAVVSVDASRCAANSNGHFDIVFVRLLEIGLEREFRQQFKWSPPSVRVALDFWADEAVEVEGVWIDNITPCQCADQAGSR